MYVEFADGYIVPCEELKRIPGWAKVRLRPAPPNDHLSWDQWVRLGCLLTEEEVNALDLD